MTTLRQLTKDDVGSFRRIRLFGLQESPAAFGASIAQEEKMPVDELAKRLEGTADRWVIGAFSEDELVGVIGFVRDDGEKMRHKGFIWGMYVVPGFRGKGVGRALFEDALARIDALPGLWSVRLSVVTSNHLALRLYEKFGFVRYGLETEALNVSGTFHSEFHMVRRTRM
ncbi:MAG: GNAT family N-acetyltransferase [Pseudomonadota bacterium]